MSKGQIAVTNVLELHNLIAPLVLSIASLTTMSETMTRRSFLGETVKLGAVTTAIGMGGTLVYEMLQNPVKESPSSTIGGGQPETKPPIIPPTVTPEQRRFALPTDPNIIRGRTIEAISGQFSLNEAQIREILKSYNSPKALQNAAQKFILSAKEFNIDPAFCLAFLIAESSGGTQGWAVTNLSVGNIRATYDNSGKLYNETSSVHYDDGGGYRKYDSWEDGIEDWFALIRNLYIDYKDLRSPELIIPVYAPSKDHNIPENYIKTVCKLVSDWRKQYANVSVPTPTLPPLETMRTYRAEAIKQLVINQYALERPPITCDDDCAPKRIILHYSEGTYDTEPEVEQAYHFSIGPTGEVDEGSHWPESNGLDLNGNLTDPAIHTAFHNTNSLGIAIRGMKDIANGEDCSTPGNYPIRPKAFEAMCMLTALECKKYGIKPSTETIRTHDEYTHEDEGREYINAQGTKTYYDSQGQHNDMGCLSFLPGYKPEQVKKLILERVMYYYNDKNVYFENPEKVKLVKP